MPKLLYTWYFEKFTASVTSSGHSALRHEVSRICTILGLDRVPSEMFFKFCDASDDMRQTRASRGHNWKIFKPQHTLDVRKHTFSVRIINDWNSLSAEVVNAESLNIFKNKLDKLWVLDMYRNPFNPC